MLVALGRFLLLQFGESYGILYVALPVTVGGSPLFPGVTLLAPDRKKGGGRCGHIRGAVPVLPCTYRHYRSGCPDRKKEVTAPKPKSAVTS